MYLVRIVKNKLYFTSSWIHNRLQVVTGRYTSTHDTGSLFELAMLALFIAILYSLSVGSSSGNKLKEIFILQTKQPASCTSLGAPPVNSSTVNIQGFRTLRAQKSRKTAHLILPNSLVL